LQQFSWLDQWFPGVMIKKSIQQNYNPY
jgi:hypothetical protein